MANYYGKQNRAYSVGQPLSGIFPAPIVVSGATNTPKTTDHAEVGQMWVNTTLDSFYVLTSDAGGTATWLPMSTASGAITGTQLTITPGPTSITGTIVFPSILNKVLVTNGTGTVSGTAATDGQVLVGSTGGAPAWTTITAGTGIVVTNGAGTVTISSPDSGITWESKAVNFAALSNYGYRITAAGVTATLPASPTIGDVVVITQDVASGTVLNVSPDAADTINWGGAALAAGVGLKTTALTTVGTGPTDQIGCYLEFVATSASNWNVAAVQGNWVPNA